ncbi:hypothetical protein [Paenibacillus soyae]|uniref:Uncharacterized protein n=1 Tax=Paenibacillus soyae TaxID=2969249 RepID=A0A9X2MS97_9BACL|nr:hypothetical protein [Paenibacillus soyae]MCR2805352.1 hypothetical protein [Paenibacillus soyae]
MLKTKAAICAFLCLSLIAGGALLHHRLKVERFPYDMRPPLPGGGYRIYNDFDSSENGFTFIPYQPREYVRIINTASEDAPE